MVEKSDSFVGRLEADENERKELLRVVGEALEEALQEKVLSRLPNNAPKRMIERAYPQFLKDNPEFARVVEGLKTGNITTHDVGAFLLTKQYAAEEENNMKQRMLATAKQAMVDRGLPENFALTGLFLQREEDSVHLLVKEVTEDPFVVEARAAYLSSLHRYKLYDHALATISEKDVTSAIAANSAEKSRVR